MFDIPGNSRLTVRTLRSVFRRTAVAISLVATVAGSVSAQSLCTSAMLQDASQAFEFGRFATTFDLLTPCIPDGFANRVEQSQAYRLQALSYLATDSLALARQTIRNLLRHDPEFRANPAVDPVQFVRIVDDYKPNWYSWLWRGNDWKKWTGRTLIVGALVATPLLLRSEPVPDLPEPPGLPE